MFLRFFALQVVVEDVDSSGVVSAEAHGLESGEFVRYARPKAPVMRFGDAVAEQEARCAEDSGMHAQPAEGALLLVEVIDPNDEIIEGMRVRV